MTIIVIVQLKALIGECWPYQLTPVPEKSIQEEWHVENKKVKRVQPKSGYRQAKLKA